MNYYDLQAQDILNQVAANDLAAQQQLALLNEQFINPYDGNFAANQVAFNTATSIYSWQEAYELAQYLPDNQPIPGFSAMDLFQANMGASQAGWDYINQQQINFGTNGAIGDAYAGAIGGTATVIDPNTGGTWGVSNQYEYQFLDPWGTPVGSNVWIEDPMYTPLQYTFYS